ncbi:MAG: antitoxin [Bifidobacteriaceae bacterium]|nr:antitoxin [Bifidobacteriaceae bacterium]
MLTTTVFRSNKTQAVRLPKAVALPDDVRRVEVRVVGSSRIITPVGASWDDWFDTFEPVSEGFGTDRMSGSGLEREQWWN